LDKFLQLPRYPFTRSMIELAPDVPGLYGLFEGDDLIYLGKTVEGAAKAATIRACLLQHQSGALGDCTRKATTYTWEIAIWPGQREAQILQGRLPPRCQSDAA
jgi:hypothetical protein